MSQLPEAEDSVAIIIDEEAQAAWRQDGFDLEECGIHAASLAKRAAAIRQCMAAAQERLEDNGARNAVVSSMGNFALHFGYGQPIKRLQAWWLECHVSGIQARAQRIKNRRLIAD